MQEALCQAKNGMIRACGRIEEHAGYRKEDQQSANEWEDAGKWYVQAKYRLLQDEETVYHLSDNVLCCRKKLFLLQKEKLFRLFRKMNGWCASADSISDYMVNAFKNKIESAKLSVRTENNSTQSLNGEEFVSGSAMNLKGIIKNISNEDLLNVSYTILIPMEAEFQRNIIMDSYINILSSGYQKDI